MSSEPVVQRSAGLPDHAPRIEVGAFPPWDTNAYLVWDGSSPEALIVDPGMNSTDALVGRAAANRLRVHLIANSHGHIDHIYDNAPLKRATGAPLAIHPDDAYRLDGRNNYGLEIEQVTAERDLREGERVEVGRLSFQVLHTPGHTEGSVCLYERTHQLLLAGDVLFAGSFGRTDLPGGDDDAMVASLARLARDLPDEVRVLPGHGPETTIGRERPWLERIAASGR
ncbi:MAG TPA: MBL fold metallo-hydrolase, partial [Candidatus Limnocylindria bacterium]|nr:MBL fold metallo-hydrolase [Candidatus Limnocylindria bacterium]